MSLTLSLIGSLIGNSRTKKMNLRMSEILEKYQANLKSSSETNLELENWLNEQKNK